MSALAQSRRIREERWTYKQFQLAAVAVYQGGVACIDLATGYITKASAASTLKVIGLFAEDVDNSAGNPGDKVVNVKLARELVLYRFVNGGGGDAVANTDRGKPVYFLDDQTVSIDPAGKSLAGVVWDVDTTKGVAVELFIVNDQALTAPVIDSFVNAAHDHSNAANGGPSKLSTGATLSFTAGDCAIATPGKGVHYKVPTTAANSTVTLGTTGAARGDEIVFTADGTANGHTVTYYDGATAISAAATASKRHRAVCTYDGAKWACSLNVGP